MGWFKKKQRCLGLDIGEHSITMVEVAQNGNKHGLVNYVSTPTPKGALDGEFIRDGGILVETLRQMATTIHGELPPVATSISGQSVFIRHLTLPMMPDDELSEAVKYEAESHLPIPRKEATIDYLKVGEVNEAGVKKQEVMVVAARKHAVEQLAELIKAAGLQPVAMDVEPLALFRTLTLSLRGNQKLPDCFTVVQMGANSTNISIFHNNILRFTRTLPTGGNKLNAALVNHYGMSVEEAESTKRLLDFSGNLDDHGLAVLLHQKLELVSPILESLLAEIKRSNEYFTTKYRYVEIQEVFLTGGGSLLRGLDTFMMDGLAVPTSIINPLDYLQIGQNLRVRENEILEAGSALALVVGLALSEVS